MTWRRPGGGNPDDGRLRPSGPPQVDAPTETRSASPTVTGASATMWLGRLRRQRRACSVGARGWSTGAVSRPCDEATSTSVGRARSKGSRSTVMSVGLIRFGGSGRWRSPAFVGSRTGCLMVSVMQHRRRGRQVRAWSQKGSPREQRARSSRQRGGRATDSRSGNP